MFTKKKKGSTLPSRTNSDGYAARNVGLPWFLCSSYSQQRYRREKNCRTNGPFAGHRGKALACYKACGKDPYIAGGYLKKIGGDLIRPGVENCQPIIVEYATRGGAMRNMAMFKTTDDV